MENRVVKFNGGNISDPVVEELMQKRDEEFKELSRSSAKQFARKNLPAPTGDQLAPYTADIKAMHEKLAAEVKCRLQPDAHIPEARMDADHFKEKAKDIRLKTKDLEHKNRIDEFELGEFHHGNIPMRIRWALGATAIITLGEIAFNTKAFQIVGENLLFALFLSVCVSFAVLVFAHVSPFLIKAVKTRVQKLSVAGAALAIVTVLFIALAIFRSNYLAVHDVHINPVYFVIINVFFFLVSAVLSYFVLPSWTEIKQNALRLKIQSRIKRRKREIAQLNAELEKIREIILERTKMRLRIAHLSNYAADRVRKMYRESIGIFKTTNLIYRADRKTPDCFNEEVPEPDIEQFLFSIANSNSFNYEDNNSDDADDCGDHLAHSV